jgi:hypothetical protein
VTKEKYNRPTSFPSDGFSGPFEMHAASLGSTPTALEAMTFIISSIPIMAKLDWLPSPQIFRPSIGFSGQKKFETEVLPD